MSSGSLFDSESEKRPNFKIFAIGLFVFIVLSGIGYGAFLYSKPLQKSHEEMLATDIRDFTVLMLAQPKFSGEEFSEQILGKGRIVKYARLQKEAYFTFPETSEEEFKEFLAKYLINDTKVEFGNLENGRIVLGDYKLRPSPEASRFFKTPAGNIKIDSAQNLTFGFNGVNYTVSLGELRNLTNNSQLYGGKLMTQMPTRSDEPQMVFANHGIMVAKPNEPSLKRLSDELLKDVGNDREARIQRLVDFVSNEIEYSYTEAVGSNETLKRASETLMTRSADCSNKTILLASLLEQIGEEYVLLYCPQHITVAIPQGNYENINKLDFVWEGKPWMIAETTLPGFQIGKTNVMDSNKLTKINYVQNPKLPDVIFDANSYALLKFL